MKRVYVVLALAVVLGMGLCGHVIASEQVPDLLFAEGFEEGDSALPSGWTIFSEGSMARTADVAHTGEYSFYMNDPGKSVSVGIRSPLMPIAAGKEYVASGWVLVQDGNAQVYLEYLDANSKRVDATWTTVEIPALGEWQEAVVQKVAPTKAKYAAVIIYIGKSVVGSSHFDDVKLTLAP